MKVLMIGAGRHPSTFIARQITTLRESGVQVDCMPDPTRFRYASAKLARAGFTRHLGRRALQMVAAADILHFQWAAHFIRYGRLATQFGKPSVLSLRGRQVNILPHLPHFRGFAQDLRRWLPRCTAYHCVSEAIRDEAEAFGLVRDRAWVIRPAIDPDAFVPGKAEVTGSLEVIMVGALMWRKGYQYSLLAIRDAVARGTEIHATIVGDGPDEDQVRYAIHDLGLADRVRLVGSLPPEQVVTHLQRSHVFLLTSLSEGIANVLLEAMACELPIVATAAGGNAEAIRDGVDGFLVPTRDWAQAASALEQLARDVEMRRRMGESGRRRVVEEFSLQQQGQRFLRMYESLVP